MKTRIFSDLSHRESPVLFFLIGIIWLSTMVPGRSQVAEWSFENITSAVPNLPIPASSSIPYVSAVARLSGGNNNGSPDACFGSETWSTNFWPTGDTRSTSDYLEFAIQAYPGETIGIDHFSFSSNASSDNSALNFEVHYSVNNFTTSKLLFSGTQGTGACTSHGGSLNARILSNATLRFRIYPYGQNPAAQAATIRMDNVQVSGSLLPVSLLHFSGRQENDGIRLEWATGSEVNNAFFAVERSADGLDFAEIGQVAGSGNHSSTQHYHFYDTAPLAAVSYYRLRQIDQDGEESLHPVVQVTYESKNLKEEELRIWPTVAGSELTIQVRSGLSDYLLEIWDLNGGFVRPVPVMNDKERFSVNLQDLSNGWYVVVLRNADRRIVRRFFKG